MLKSLRSYWYWVGKGGGGREDTNLTNPTQHKLRWSNERHTSQRIQIENAFKPTAEGQITFNLCTELYLRSFSKVRKNWQHFSQEFYWRMWIGSNTHQTAVFLLPSDSFWPMKHECFHLCHWVQAGKAQMWLCSLSLFPVTEAACSRWCTCKSLTDHKHL